MSVSCGPDIASPLRGIEKTSLGVTALLVPPSGKNQAEGKP